MLTAWAFSRVIPASRIESLRIGIFAVTVLPARRKVCFGKRPFPAGVEAGFGFIVSGAADFQWFLLSPLDHVRPHTSFVEPPPTPFG